MPFDHGVPIVIRKGSSVLILEFESLPPEQVSRRGESTFQVLAPYRFQTLDLAQSPPMTGSGTATLKEHYSFKNRTKANGTTTRQLTDIDSTETINHGPFRIEWSNGGSGQRSWLYFVRASGIEYVRAHPERSFESIDASFLESIREYRNIFQAKFQERTLLAFGDVYANPTLAASSARIVKIASHAGGIILTMENLISDRAYFIEQSSSLTPGGWEISKEFVAAGPTIQQKLPIAPTGPSLFFRLKTKPD